MTVMGVPSSGPRDAHNFGPVLLPQAQKLPRQLREKDVDSFACGGIARSAVGDALGVPLEFTGHDEHLPVTEMVGGGPSRPNSKHSLARCHQDEASCSVVIVQSGAFIAA